MNRITITEDYSISTVINGCWQLSSGHSLQNKLDYSDIMRAFYLLTEKGFTTFDCADIYTGVEEFIGRFIAELKAGKGISANDIQVHTKYVPDLAELANVDFAFTESIIDRSLKRLNKDCLDIVQFHWWDYEVDGCVDVAGHLVRLQEKGKIKHIGVTNFDTVHLKKLVDAGIPIVSMQGQYSLLDRRPEKGLLDYCAQNNIKVFCYGTLCGGFLSEKYIGKDVSNPETRSQVKYAQIIEDSIGWEHYGSLLELLAAIGKEHDASVSNIATKYILSQPTVASTIVGIRNSKHVTDNEKLFSFELTVEELAEIKKFMDRFPCPEGEPFELERTIGSKYRGIMKMNINNYEQNN